MIAILDYDAGNIKSVEKAVNFLGEKAVITRDRDVILASDKVILPGVGSFGDAMNKIREYISSIRSSMMWWIRRLRFLESVLDYSFCIRRVRKAREQPDLAS